MPRPLDDGDELRAGQLIIATGVPDVLPDIDGVEFDQEALDTLAAVGIPLIDEQVSAAEVTEDAISGLRLADGRTVPVEAVGVSSGMRANLDGLEALGLETEINPQGTFLRADDTGHTNVPGVWGTGNVMDPDLQLSECISHGARVAVTINNGLIFGDAEAALAATRKSV